MARILTVDDEASVLFMLRELLEERGHEVCAASDATAALALLNTAAELDTLDLVLTDYAMPGLDGLALLTRLRELRSDLPVVLLTARGSERLAVRALKAGAFDYLPKPFDIDELEAIVGRALELSALTRGASRTQLQASLGRAFVGEAPQFLAVLDQAVRIARRDLPVVVRGETGTGKELLAALLHEGSARRKQPFVRFNCAAIVPELAESELFGHVRGAFTGASSAHRGYFARAHGGTLVLDEIGDLPERLQPKLLRALSSGEIQPVGSSKVERVDVRVIACTHKDLMAEVKAGRFREDLYYRLSVVELTLPSLAERRGDIPTLARHFARAAGERFGLEGVVLSSALCDALAQRTFPGNVRELENLVTRLVALSEGGVIDAPALSAGTPPATGSAEPAASFRAQVEALEQRLLRKALADAAGNQSEAARLLSLSRATFLDKLKRHGVG